MTKKQLLTITFFKEFSIKSPHCELRSGSTISTQITLLISYLVASGSSHVPKAALMEVLWPNSCEKNLEGALRNLVYRARRELHKLYPNDTLEYICFSHDSYYWNPDITCTIDIFAFEKYYSLSKTEPDEERRIDYLTKMYHLYTGEFLPTCTFAEWVLYRGVYYRNLFLYAALEICKYLSKKGLFQELIPLCDHSIILYPEEERFYRFKLEAYVNNGFMQTALEYYHNTVDLFSQKFGIDVRESFDDIYQNLLLLVPGERKTFKELEEYLEGNMHSWADNTFYCNPDIFRSYYQIALRSAKRFPIQQHLVLLTLSAAQENDTPLPDYMTDEMLILANVLTSQLRKNDVYTRISTTQFAALLAMNDNSSPTNAMQRISAGYKKLKKHTDIHLHIEERLIQ